MSKRKPIILLMIAVFLGFLATSAMAKYFERQGGAAAGKPVIVAASDLAPGTQIKKEHIKEVRWPADKIPATMISAESDAIDKYVSSAIAAGEPVLKSKISQAKRAGDLSGYIPSGYRAMAIKMDPAVKAGGLLAPDCFVDVITVISDRDHDPVSMIILQNIKVLSVGVRPTEGDDKEKKKSAAGNQEEEVVTLLLRPDEAEKLALAMSRGKIQLVARGNADTARSDTGGSSADALLSKPHETPKKAEPAPKVAKPDQPSQKQLAEALLNNAMLLEAKGETEAAKKAYAEVSEKYPDQKTAVDAANRLTAMTAADEERRRETVVGKAIESVESVIGRGMFDDARQKTTDLLDEFGAITYRGEKISDIVGNLKVRANNDEKKARVEFQLFKNWMQNGNLANAKTHLKKLEARFPESTYYQQALKMYADAAGKQAASAQPAASTQQPAPAAAPAGTTERQTNTETTEEPGSNETN